MEYFYSAQFYEPLKGRPASTIIPSEHEYKTSFHQGYLKAADEEDAICVALSLGPAGETGDRYPARSVVISACADDYFRGRKYLRRWLAAPFASAKRKIEIVKKLSGGYIIK